jgi:GDPmannose 4,6-dehydratase
MIAIISGITGQDGSYLAKLLLDKGYEVIGLTRSINSLKFFNLDYLGVHDSISFIECDLLEFHSISNIILKHKPDEFYNLSAQSSVAYSLGHPLSTIQYNINSVLNILESIRLFSCATKYFQASSGEIYGSVKVLPATELTPFNPINPYAVSKASAYFITKSYREIFKLFTVNGILFNHESFLRPRGFFIKKVIVGALDIKFQKINFLKLGNLNIKRDFGFAPDYINAIYLSMNVTSPDDFIISSGVSVYLKDIVAYVFNKLDVSMDSITITDEFKRNSDINDLYGSNLKAKSILNWHYEKSFFDVIDQLLAEELLNYKNI